MLCFNTPVVWFQLSNSYGEMCFLEENYKKMHTIQIHDKKNWERLLYKIIEYAFKITIHVGWYISESKNMAITIYYVPIPEIYSSATKQDKEGKNESLFQNNSPNICHFLKSDTCKLLYLRLSIDLLHIFHNAP